METCYGQRLQQAWGGLEFLNTVFAVCNFLYDDLSRWVFDRRIVINGRSAVNAHVLYIASACQAARPLREGDSDLQDALFCAMVPRLSVRSFQPSRHSVQFQGKETLDVYLHPESLR